MTLIGRRIIIRIVIHLLLIRLFPVWRKTLKLLKGQLLILCSLIWGSNLKSLIKMIENCSSRHLSDSIRGSKYLSASESIDGFLVRRMRKIGIKSLRKINTSLRTLLTLLRKYYRKCQLNKTTAPRRLRFCKISISSILI